VQLSDWFNAFAVVGPLSVVFVFGFGLFEGPELNRSVKAVWTVGAFGLAWLTWYAGARQARDGREQATRVKQMLTLLGAEFSPLLPKAVSDNAYQLTTDIVGFIHANQFYIDPPVGMADIARFAQKHERGTAELYTKIFGGRVQDLLEQFRRQGVILPHDDEHYLRPKTEKGIFSAAREVANAAYTIQQKKTTFS
jgi:hypothetical protein